MPSAHTPFFNSTNLDEWSWQCEGGKGGSHRAPVMYGYSHPCRAERYCCDLSESLGLSKAWRNLPAGWTVSPLPIRYFSIGWGKGLAPGIFLLLHLEKKRGCLPEQSEIGFCCHLRTVPRPVHLRQNLLLVVFSLPVGFPAFSLTRTGTSVRRYSHGISPELSSRDRRILMVT
jgi:hypothetical protein